LLILRLCGIRLWLPSLLIYIPVIVVSPVVVSCICGWMDVYISELGLEVIGLD